MPGLKMVLTLPDIDSIRIDKWLWAARFFKTRKLAAEAVSGGKVHINGQRCKPAKEITVGARLLISKDQFSWDITVKAINKQRRPASEAVLLYEEDSVSLSERKEKIALHKQQQAFNNYSERETKPNKKQRRQIHRFKQK